MGNSSMTQSNTFVVRMQKAAHLLAIPARSIVPAQQTCSILPEPPLLGPRSRATNRLNCSIIIPNRLRERAASHRPLDDSSLMKACCACTSINLELALSDCMISPRKRKREAHGRLHSCVVESVPDQSPACSVDVGILSNQLVRHVFVREKL